MKVLRKTKIVGTIGPASEKKLEELFDAGLSVCRINYSHGSYDEQKEKTEEIIRLRKELDLPIPMILDMQGPEIRTGMLVTGKNEKIKLEDGQKFTLVCGEDIVGDKDKVAVTYKELYKDLKVGAKVLIDDGAIELVVDKINGTDIECTVVHGNGLGSRKTMNLPGTAIRLPALKQKDIDDLITACKHDYDFVAVSFTRNVDDINQVRKVLDENGGTDVKIVTKVENVEGLSMEEIVEKADVQMIARGDMATETDFTEPPIMQKKFIKLCNRANKPAITATQMLESMTHQPLPTRAEASDVANAVYDRTSAVMLSGECAMGEYPVECVATMDKIARRVEETLDYWKKFEENTNLNLESLEDNIAYSTCIVAKNMKASAIVCYTNSGDTARRLAGMGAGCPILAVTDNRRTFNQLGIAWNVFPVLVDENNDKSKAIEKGIQKLKEKQILEAGDTIIVAGGKDFMDGVSSSKQIGGYVKI